MTSTPVHDLPVADWAALCRRVLRTTWPYSAQHTSSGPDDVDVTPTRLHPAFHGCFDWHSSVHMHWSLVRLATLAPDHIGVADTVALLDERLTPQTVDVCATTRRGNGRTAGAGPRRSRPRVRTPTTRTHRPGPRPPSRCSTPWRAW